MFAFVLKMCFDEMHLARYLRTKCQVKVCSGVVINYSIMNLHITNEDLLFFLVGMTRKYECINGILILIYYSKKENSVGS